MEGRYIDQNLMLGFVFIIRDTMKTVVTVPAKVKDLIFFDVNVPKGVLFALHTRLMIKT